MAEHKLELLEEGNPEYHSLVKEYNEIMKEWDRLKELVNSFNLPKIRIWKLYLPKVNPFNSGIYLLELSKIGKDAMSLQKRFPE